MKIELTGAQMLTPPEMLEMAARLDALHQRTIKTIDRLQQEVAAQKARIASRWKSVSALGPIERQRVAAEETAAAVTSIRQNSKDELDRILREAGASHAPLVAQRPYYASRAAVLSRQGLGTERRALLEQSAERARQVGLAGLAQLAIGTGDLVLAAVVFNENDRRRQSERGFSSAEFLSLVPGPDEFEKANQYILIAENRMNAIALAIRVWQTARPAPVSALSLAMSRAAEDGDIVREIAEDGAIIEALDDANAGAAD